MFKQKKILIPFILIIIESIIIVVLLILSNMARSSVNTSDGDSDNTDDLVCDENGECELVGEYDEADILPFFYVDSEMYGEDFLDTYAYILKEEPVPEENFYPFVVLSEYYTSYYYESPIDGELSPSRYYASSRRIETNKYVYPGNVLRSVMIELSDGSCAKFEFTADFSYLRNYRLLKGGCSE